MSEILRSQADPPPAPDTIPTELPIVQKDLSQSLFEGLAWTGSIKWLGQLLSWGSTVVIARLLSPSDYGVVGMAMLFRELMQMITDFGVGSAIVTMDELDQNSIEQLNSVSLMLGFAALLVSSILAKPLEIYFRMPGLATVILVISATFVMASVQVIPMAMLQRRLRYKLISIFEGIRNLVLAVAVITFALFGFGYWALVFGSVLSTLVMVTLVLVEERSSFRVPHMNSTKRALHFSGQLLVTRVAWFSWSNADFLVAGRRFGEAGLGAYTLAWNLASVPVDKITAVVLSVTPGYFSALQRNKEELRKYVLTLTEVLALVTFPAAIGITLEARNFVINVLGAKWSAAVVPLQFLAICALLRCLTPILSQALIATRHTRFEMVRSVSMAILMPVGFFIGSVWGITGIAVAWLAVYPALCLPLYWKSLKELDCGLLTYLRSLRGAILSCACMCAAILTARLAFTPGRGWFALGLETCLGGAVYVAAAMLISRERIVGLWKRVRGASA